MRNSGMSKLQYLLYALLMFALAGCGLSNLAGNGTGAPNSVAAKLAFSASKGTAKTLASVPAGVSSISVTVTGTGADNVTPIPVVRGTLPTDGTQGSIGGIYPGAVTLSVKALDTNKVVLYEGFAIGVVVAAAPAPAANAGIIVLSPPVEKAQDQPCIACHETTLDVTGQNLIAEFKQSGHYTNSAWNTNVDFPGVVGTGCAGCHGPSHNLANPATSGRCYECHGATGAVAHNGNAATGLDDFQNKCDSCHNSHNPAKFVGSGCTVCHAVAQNAGSNNFVNDNNGVRSITNEFSKWSHHVTGVTLNDAHCAACHLEGKIANGKVVVDETKHMSDNMTHLRNADTDADFSWDPANPNHTGMDNFCLSCHDGNGATSPMSAQIQAFINANGLNAPGKTASATNPFGDTISNRYDKMQRPAVVDAFDQFNPSNNSHHAVRGQRYSGRTRAAGPRQIASAATFAQNSSSVLKGARSTIYDAGNFNALYSPLGTDGTAATGLGDDSTLHCGDCHTVGQWKVGSSDTANGSPTPAAIGAHGANNEYLLRNTLGTDQRHTQNAFTLSGTNVVTYTNPGGAFLVCYNCHAYTKYGSIYVGTGLNTTGTPLGVQPHAGEYDQGARCNGVSNTLPFNGYTTGKATDGTQFAPRLLGIIGVNTPAAPYAGELSAGGSTDGAPIFQIQCLNCHNSSVANAFGGIHGSAKSMNTATQTVNPSVTGGSYIDGMGNTNKIERFLPGLGNVMHVPGTLGGVTGGTTATTVNLGTGNYTYTTGGISNDTNWEQKFWQQTATTTFDLTGKTAPVGVSAGAGCYTLGTTTVSSNITAGLSGPSVTGANGAATQPYGTWGACTDHSAGQGEGNHGFVKRIVRPVTY